MKRQLHCLIRKLGIAFQIRWVFQEPNINLIARVSQQAGRHKAIAAIVSRPTKDESLAAIRRERPYPVRDGGPGFVHEVDTRDTALNRELIRTRHFFRSQKLQLLGMRAADWTRCGQEDLQKTCRGSRSPRFRHS